METRDTAPEGATDPWEVLRGELYGATLYSEEVAAVDRARAAVEAQHQRDRELLMDTILKQDAEIEKLTRERDKLRTDIAQHRSDRILRERLQWQKRAEKAEVELDALDAHVATLREALQRLAYNQLSDDNCASVELAGRRVAAIARAALAATEGGSHE